MHHKYRQLCLGAADELLDETSTVVVSFQPPAAQRLQEARNG